MQYLGCSEGCSCSWSSDLVPRRGCSFPQRLRGGTQGSPEGWGAQNAPQEQQELSGELKLCRQRRRDGRADNISSKENKSVMGSPNAFCAVPRAGTRESSPCCPQRAPQKARCASDGNSSWDSRAGICVNGAVRD